jgi:hypothetical protein
MKKSFIILITLSLIVISLLSVSSFAQNFYQQDGLSIKLDVKEEIELTSTKENSELKEISAKILLYPKDDYRQKIIDWDSEGSIEDNQVDFFWNDGLINNKNFGFSSTIKTNNNRVQVTKKISFPINLDDIEDKLEYLKPTKTIDSDNPEIIAKASELAEGEDDLFKVVFKLAEWVDSNVVYDLNTLTESASQKASWVLENKEGVCDEMTSLFVAMARSLGIPARFTSGISYTTSDLFDENWQPHGWAEVYFPGTGWVSFDITFGEYGYIDVTHIKLRDGFDPAEPATKFEWLANNVDLDAKNLKFDVKIIDSGVFVSEKIVLEQEILAKEIGSGSYNLIKGILKNTADYYAATTLKLAIPDEVEIIGNNKRTILLSPKEVRETFWVIKLQEDLLPNYLYQFPTLIYTEKNISVQDSFEAKIGNNIYSQEEIEKLVINDEEKTYSRKINFDCKFSEEISINEKATAECNIKNSGNTNLKKINYCLEDTCKEIDLSINQKASLSIEMASVNVGWNKIIVRANSDILEKRTALEYLVLDSPKVSIEAEYPKEILIDSSVKISLNLDKESYSVPQMVRIKLMGPGFENIWEIDELTNQEELILELDYLKIAKNNEFSIITSWKDKKGEQFSEIKEFNVVGTGNSLFQKIKLLFNGIIRIFS